MQGDIAEASVVRMAIAATAPELVGKELGGGEGGEGGGGRGGEGGGGGGGNTGGEMLRSGGEAANKGWARGSSSSCSSSSSLSRDPSGVASSGKVILFSIAWGVATVGRYMLGHAPHLPLMCDNRPRYRNVRVGRVWVRGKFARRCYPMDTT